MAPRLPATPSLRPGARGHLGTAVAAGLGCLAVAGCGGGTRQDADEPTGTFRVDVVRAQFPERQRLARQEALEITVRNAGSQPVPNLAVTVDGFSTRSTASDLADPERPVWIVDRAPTGGDTAYTGTWALGRLGPGQTRRFVWRVTAIRPGTHRLRWRVAAGLDGRARAVGDGGAAPEGSFSVRVSRRPVASRVNPATGEVQRLDEAETGG